MDFNLKTESTVDPNALILLGIVLLIAGSGIILIYQLAKR